MYEVAIIGTGPAGLSAALTLKARDKKFIWIGSKNLSDKVEKAECIANYPGFTNISGAKLTKAFRLQVEEMGIEITEQMVNSILPMSGHYALMAGSEFYEAKTVILATGIVSAAAYPGERELVGKGVSYCATCDGNLYRGKTIAVVCNNARFEHEVKYLAEIVQKLYYFPTYNNTTISADNIEIPSAKMVGILGEERTNAVKLQGGNELLVDGVFCLRDSLALSTLIPNLETENGHIAVDRLMATNLSGVYAAGDCTGRPYQYAKAAGEGNVAAHSVLEFLAQAEQESR